MTGTRAVTLVTGGAGFIGSHLVDRLLALGHDVRVVDNLSTGNANNLSSVLDKIDFVRGDLRDEAVCRRAVQGAELVFHVAALPSVPRSLADPWTSHDCNVNATLRLLIACADAQVRRVVYSSSSSTYGDTATLRRWKQRSRSHGLPTRGQAGGRAVCPGVRPGGPRGRGRAPVLQRIRTTPGPELTLRCGHPDVSRRRSRRRPAVVFGDGTQTRDFTYVANVVEANVLAAKAPAARANARW